MTWPRLNVPDAMQPSADQARPLNGTPSCWSNLYVPVSAQAVTPPTHGCAVQSHRSATFRIGPFCTSTVAEPLPFSLVAVMVAVPAATPWTTPEADTVATAGALVDQFTCRPVTTL